MDSSLIKWTNNNRSNQKNHFLLPSPSMRALIVGASGCGKTNLLLKLLLQSDWLDYNNLNIFGKSLHQPEYKLLKACFDKGYKKENILNFFTTGKGDIDKYIKEIPIADKKKNINVNYYEDSELVPNPNSVNCKKKSIFVFDDIMTDKNQSEAESYFTRGRHNNISSIYIAQNFHKLPRQTIRSNANILMLFSLPNKDLIHIHNDFIGTDMEWKEFSDFCQNAFKIPYSFIVINKTMEADCGRYQVNLNKVYIPNKYS